MCTHSPDEAKTKLPLKVSTSLAQVLEKLDLSKKAEREKQGEQLLLPVSSNASLTLM